jgi:hypothetical protein
MNMLNTYTGDAIQMLRWYFSPAQRELRCATMARLLNDMRNSISDRANTQTKTEKSRRKAKKARLDVVKQETLVS